MTARHEMLRAKAREIAPQLKTARDVAAKAAAEDRPMTGDERAIYDAAIAKAQPVLDALDAARNDDAIIAEARAFAGTVTSPGKAADRLSFKSMAPAIAAKMLGTTSGQKSLNLTGTALVPQSFVPDPVALGRPATGLLDILRTRQQDSPSFAYLRQVLRDNQAGVVAEHGLKPTTELGLERVEATLDVVAHVSDPQPRFWLQDVVELERFIDLELRTGLAVAVEQKVLSDIGSTSGTQVQAFSVSPLETLRRAATKLEVVGHQAVAAVLHPEDWAEIELALASSNAVERMGLPFDPVTRRVFGIVVASTVSQTPGTAHVIDSDAIELATDPQGVQVDWSENAGAETFARNEVVCRVEGRYQTSVLSPLGVVTCDLTSGA